jgi:hypothetical protein
MIKLIPGQRVALDSLAIIGCEIAKGILESRCEIVVGAKNIKARNIQKLVEGLKNYGDGINGTKKISRADNEIRMGSWPCGRIGICACRTTKLITTPS